MARWLVSPHHQGQAISYGEHCNSLQSLSHDQSRLWQGRGSCSQQHTPMFGPKQCALRQTRCASFHSLGVWQWHKQPSQWWNHLWWLTWCQVMYISSRVVPGLITCYTSTNWCDDQILDVAPRLYVLCLIYPYMWCNVWCNVNNETQWTQWCMPWVSCLPRYLYWWWPNHWHHGLGLPIGGQNLSFLKPFRALWHLCRVMYGLAMECAYYIVAKFSLDSILFNWCLI